MQEEPTETHKNHWFTKNLEKRYSKTSFFKTKIHWHSIKKHKKLNNCCQKNSLSSIVSKQFLLHDCLTTLPFGHFETFKDKFDAAIVIENDREGALSWTGSYSDSATLSKIVVLDPVMSM